MTLSREDRDPLCEEPTALIEVIAAIRCGGTRLRQSEYYLMAYEDGYVYRVAGYACQQRFCRVEVSVQNRRLRR